VPAHPLLAGCADVLDLASQQAERIDVDGVTRQDVDELARCGYLGAWAPAGLGGGGAPEAVVRELTERLAGASGALWFVATQHRSPALVALESPNDAVRERWARPLAAGEALGAVAFAHLRRPGPPGVTARPDGTGWLVDGRLDWVTSWGLADALLLMAETPEGDVVQALLPAAPRPGLVVTGPLALAAMGGTSTVGVRLEGLRVDADEVALVLPKATWAARDAERTANATPASLGLARAATSRLAAVADRRGSTASAALAERLAERIVAVRREAYALMDDVPAAEQLDRRVALRAEALDLAHRAAVAVVATEGGRAMLLDSPGQRWAREALFHLVQAQTAPLREQLLAGWDSQIRPA
jgi:alkylation response protein AidB-like acyl-CoA dehydrogenase